MKQPVSNPAPQATQPSADPVPWHPLSGVLFVIVTFAAAQFLALAIIEVYPLLNHWSGTQANDWLDNSVLAQFFFVLIAEAISIGAIYLFLKRHKLGLAAIGLKRPRWTDPLWGIAGFLPYLFFYGVLIVLIAQFVPSFNVDQSQDVGFNDVVGHSQLVLTFISLVVLPPLAEEIMVRGFLYTTLKKALPIMPAALVTSALFGAAHLGEGGSGGLLWVGFVDTFILSLVLIWLRELTGSLWASITLHAIKNGIAFVSLFVLHIH